MISFEGALAFSEVHSSKILHVQVAQWFAMLPLPSPAYFSLLDRGYDARRKKQPARGQRTSEDLGCAR